ncbi:cycle-inhibiting factor [Photorhabdus bodei]|uniref:Cycle-inhibiting factor n=2 Tax=Photorhabdus TaxID=29487 RepID=A0ABX0AVM3_9GAMM|nr:cycle-inhibiting factor [Photorhabdus bodei]NDL11180.1 cycle-inhibiting factor [Photorhabdus kayaii]MCC8374591.1 cycle-inhibiting factor [Photorhabdus bodei]MDB6367720.1 cycle-inhibiting factor [Photorhabdus bodei]MDB6371311.1 cycle-inhibiting factor [Photorhabdus bodei]NDL24811.1 cycle-inhibiting factor [Photorhabdus kayaii]
MGEGALPPLKIADWLSARGKDPVTLNKLKKLLSHEFNLLSANEQQELIAEIFDIHKEISNVGLDKIKKDKRIDIYLTEYNINDFYENIEKLKSKFDDL